MEASGVQNHTEPFLLLFLLYGQNNSFQNISFCVPQKKVIQVENDMRVRK